VDVSLVIAANLRYQEFFRPSSRTSEIIKGLDTMKAKLTVILVVLLFTLALFAQTATQNPTPKADDKSCACCKDKDGKAMDCCKDGNCCKDAKMCARDKDGKMACCKGEMKDGKMACCGDKCPMMKGDKKDEKTAKAGCCGDKCPMKNHGEHKGM
jgi:hypothetical protein